MSLRHIASTLGLSVTTVSRALAGYTDVAEPTRIRVQAEAERIGYVPNAIARRLQKGRADAIGVVAPTGCDAISDAYVYAALNGAWARLSELDRDLVLLPSAASSDARGDEHRSFCRAVEERRVDGLLLLRTQQADWRIPYLRDANIPFVVFGAEHADQPDVTAIGTDNQAAATLVVERLAGFGHRRLVCILPEGGFDFALSRIPAITEQARLHGMELRLETAPFSEDGGEAATTRVLAARHPPTAIVYLSNRMAIGALRAFDESILVLGRHVSVISFGDNVNLRFSSPPVTAIQAPVDQMVRHAVDVLVAQADGHPIEPIRRWPVELIRRQSDGPLIDRSYGLDGGDGFVALHMPQSAE